MADRVDHAAFVWRPLRGQVEGPSLVHLIDPVGAGSSRIMGPCIMTSRPLHNVRHDILCGTLINSDALARWSCQPGERPQMGEVCEAMRR